MENLYRKTQTDSGRIRYVETCQWWDGDPKEGIWYVRRSGKTWIADCLSDLPAAWTVAKLMPHRDKICKEIDEVIHRQGYSINDIFEAVCRAVKG